MSSWNLVLMSSCLHLIISSCHHYWQLFASFVNFCQLLASFNIFLQLLSSFGNLSVVIFLATFNNFLLLLATFNNFGNFWKLLIIYIHLCIFISCHILVTYLLLSFWQLSTTFCFFWQLLAIFGNFSSYIHLCIFISCHIFILSSCHLLPCERLIS